MKKDNGEIRELEPLMIFPDVNATHLYPRWWHKFIFWKKYRYPDFMIRVERMSIKDLK